MQDDLDYMDENAERLAQRKRKTDAMKRAFAINGKKDSGLKDASLADAM